MLELVRAEQAGILLHPAAGLPRLWRYGRAAHQGHAHRNLHRVLGMGQVSGREGLEQGVDVCISSWTRIAPNTLPALSKAGANYMNSQLIRMEAAANGYAEGIALDVNGYVSEGSGENIFVVRDGKIITPPLGASVLPGITRDSVIQLAAGMGIAGDRNNCPARDAVHRRRSVLLRNGGGDHSDPLGGPHHGGRGKAGPITEKLQREFFAIVEGRVPDRFGWLTPVAQPVGARS